MAFKTAEEILKTKWIRNHYAVEAIEMRGLVLYTEEKCLEAMNEYASQFITFKDCYNCNGTGMACQMECVTCKGQGKYILLPTITNTAT
jgi:hypothetical protein